MILSSFRLGVVRRQAGVYDAIGVLPAVPVLEQLAAALGTAELVNHISIQIDVYSYYLSVLKPYVCVRVYIYIYMCVCVCVCARVYMNGCVWVRGGHPRTGIHAYVYMYSCIEL